MAEPLLSQLSLGVVDAGTGQEFRLTSAVGKNSALIVEPANLAVGANNAELGLESDRLLRGAIECGRDALAILRMDELQEILEAAFPAVTGQAEHFQQAGIEHLLVPSQIPMPDAGLGCFERQAKLRVAALKCFFF